MVEATRRPPAGASPHLRWLKRLLLGAGAIELAVGALHFAMPRYVYESKGFANLQPDELGFVTLVTLAVGILLLAFGAFTVYLAARAEPIAELLFAYSLLKVALWTGRVALEVAYPVRLRLFAVEPFTAVVMPGLVFELLLFVACAILARAVLGARAAAGGVLAG